MATLPNTSAAETLTGTDEDDAILVAPGTAGGGNDFLRGAGGADSLEGGTGDDTLHGGTGDDRLLAGPGNDLIRAGAGDDDIAPDRQDAFADTVIGGLGNDVIGDGSLFGNFWNAALRGGPGDDTVFAPEIGSVLGGEGRDLLLVEQRHLYRGEIDLGGVSAIGIARICTFRGFEDFRSSKVAGPLTVTGTGGDNDILLGYDYEMGGPALTVRGRGGNDRIEVDSESGTTVHGGRGDDTLLGGGTSDTLKGGTGRDTLSGGGIAGDGFGDRFVCRPEEDPSVIDLILDFEAGADILDLAIFARRGPLVWLGADPFTGAAGEVRMAGGLLGIDRDGDGAADFAVALAGIGTLAPADIDFG